MVRAARAFASESAHDVLNSLRTHEISFLGPFHTPGGSALFLVENNLYVKSELVELLIQNKLDREGLRELATHIALSDRVVQP